MKYSQYGNLIVPALTAGVPVILVSKPGEGKSRFLEALMAGLGRELVTVGVATRAPEDIGGLPFIVGATTRRATPDWAKRLIGLGEKGALLLEELGDAAPMMQAACMRLMLDNEVADEKLPEGVWKVAAMNPSDCNVSGFDIAPALANRLFWLQWQPELEDWARGMTEGFRAPSVRVPPENWQSNRGMARARVAVFLRRKPGLASRMPKDEDGRGGPWPSKRTWTFGADIWAAAGLDNAGDDLKGKLFAGVVGDGAALEFVQFERELDLPDPREALRRPSEIRIPKRTDAAFSFVSSVVALALEQGLTQELWDACWIVLCRVAEAKEPAVASVAALGLMREHGRLQAEGVDLVMPVKEVLPLVPVLKASGTMR